MCPAQGTGLYQHNYPLLIIVGRQAEICLIITEPINGTELIRASSNIRSMFGHISSLLW